MNLSVVLKVARSRAVWTIADQAVVSGANFATSVIIGRFGNKEDLGLYALGFTLVLLAQNTQTALITGAYQVFSPKMGEEERQPYTGSALMHHIVIAVGLAGMLLCAGLLMQRSGGAAAGLAPVVITLAFVISPILLKEFARQVSFARLHAGIALSLDASVSFMQIIGLVALALIGSLHGYSAFWVIGAATAVSALSWVVLRRDEYRVELGRVERDFWSNWSFSRWMFVTNLAWMAANQVYPWFLVVFHGPEANGEFSACNTVVFLVNPFILGLGNFIGPKTVHALVEHGLAGMKRIVRIATMLFGITIGIFAITMIFMGDWVLVLIFDDKYAGHGDLVAVLAFATLAWALTVPANYGLNAMERPDVSFKALLLSLVVTSTLGIWLVMNYGPIGVACGLLVGNLVALIYTRFVYHREARRRLRAAH